MQIAAALEQSGGFTVRRIAPDEIERAVRDGRAPVVVVPGTPPTYRFDEARAESQVARLAVDAALQRAAGRADAFAPVQQPVQTVGSRYIDWLVPGLLGMNIMSTGLWGVGFSIVNARTQEAAEAAGRDADVEVRTTCCRSSSAGWRFWRSKSVVHRRLRLARVRRRGARLALGAGGAGAARRAGVRRARPARGQPRADDRSGVGPDEPGDAADVGAVGRVLRVDAIFPTRCSRSFRRCRSPRSSTRCAASSTKGRSLAALLPQIGILAAWGSISFVLSLKLFRWQ